MWNIDFSTAKEHVKVTLSPEAFPHKINQQGTTKLLIPLQGVWYHIVERDSRNLVYGQLFLCPIYPWKYFP